MVIGYEKSEDGGVDRAGQPVRCGEAKQAKCGCYVCLKRSIDTD
jgi:hypothetical protein